eukprot:2879560-Prymnesium_polylepis.1
MRDIIFIPDASSVAAKMTKTHARGPVTGCMSGELFEVKGISVPALEVKDKLAPLETEYMLSRVGMFGRPGQPVWLDYVKTLHPFADDLKYSPMGRTFLARMAKQTQRNVFDEIRIIDDHAAVPASHMARLAAREGRRVWISGNGADEIISNYANCGKPLSHSGHHPCGCFLGRFPQNLSQDNFFPWCSFYTGCQRHALMLMETVGGAHGLEVRYPFLDTKVVQEYLWLDSSVKNSRYKRPLADYLEAHNYPNKWIPTNDRASGTLLSKAGWTFGTGREAKDIREINHAMGGCAGGPPCKSGPPLRGRAALNSSLFEEMHV